MILGEKKTDLEGYIDTDESGPQGGCFSDWVSLYQQDFTEVDHFMLYLMKAH